MSGQSHWLTAREAASYCRCSESTLLREARRGTLLMAYRLASRRVWRFKVDDLEQFLTRRSEPVQHRADARKTGR